MKKIFITGIPTAGKTFLANKIAKKTGSIHIKIDDLRKEMIEQKSLKTYVNFFLNKNEKEYWENITPEKHWQNIIEQSEAFWPFILAKIKEYKNLEKAIIIEGVNLLPHLVKDLNISGIVLLGESEESTFSRLKANPRWGNSEELLSEEAKWFYNIEGEKYKKEAEKYNFKCFKKKELAENEITKMLINIE
ncbi:MAG: hypothetical protein ACPGR5_07575 [Chitinophagales bacterium]